MCIAMKILLNLQSSLFFWLNTLFGGVTDPDPTVADAEIKSKWLITNGFCRVGVLHPAFKI
jgi:hypothetical protein